MTDCEDEKVHGNERREQACPSEPRDAFGEHRNVCDGEDDSHPEGRGLDGFPNSGEAVD